MQGGDGYDNALMRLDPRGNHEHIARDRTVFTTSRITGFADGSAQIGLFVDDTRVLDTYCWSINGSTPRATGLSTVSLNRWLGYYIASVVEPSGQTFGSAPEQALALRLWRAVGNGLYEDVELVNFSQRAAEVELALELHADFADALEMGEQRKQHGRISTEWHESAESGGSLTIRYQASNAYDHQSEHGTAHVDRSVRVSVAAADCAPAYRDGRIVFAFRLEPHGCFRARIEARACIDGERLALLPRFDAARAQPSDYDLKRAAFEESATHFTAPGQQDMTGHVVAALRRARRDLAELRLDHLDHGEHAWTVAAGIPEFASLFGRDTLAAGWQAAMLSPEVLRGTLQTLPQFQGGRRDDWREERPGRMLHQVRKGPLSALNILPFARHYASMTASAFYPVALSEYWHWTGDRDVVESLLEPALDGLRWLDEYGDLDGDGFYEYESVSEVKTKNQGWKDSGSAIVHDDGSQVEDPIATCECQAFAFAAKLRMAALLLWFGRAKQARALYDQARRLKQRFNQVFWLEDEGFVAMALDPDKRPVRSIASNAGHCVAAGILHASRVERVAMRLLSPELFSGWGVRTLSAKHPAYNPCAYQRGAVWPVEQAAFALGFTRHGLRAHAGLLCRAMFEASALFEYHRLPECFGGQTRAAEQPFPPVYVGANWPQAWSVSAVILALQSMLGLYPFAPLHLLFVDPVLPEWLPDITLERLRVGEATASIRFVRNAGGRTDYQVLDCEGPLRVVRQAMPRSLYETPGQRARDLVRSLFGHH